MGIFGTGSFELRYLRKQCLVSVGWIVGMSEVGNFVGFLEGLTVGNVVGEVVGADVGEGVGCPDGPLVGWSAVGDIDGATDGTLVGPTVGVSEDGEQVGTQHINTDFQ